MKFSAERFWALANVGDPSVCWPWKNGKDYEYPTFRHEGKKRKAHLVAWEIHNGKPFPLGKFGCHTCDFPRCINPSHIFPGSRRDNIIDAVKKGRCMNVSPNTARRMCGEDPDLWWKSDPKAIEALCYLKNCGATKRQMGYALAKVEAGAVAPTATNTGSSYQSVSAYFNPKPEGWATGQTPLTHALSECEYRDAFEKRIKHRVPAQVTLDYQMKAAGHPDAIPHDLSCPSDLLRARVEAAERDLTEAVDVLDDSVDVLREFIGSRLRGAAAIAAHKRGRAIVAAYDAKHGGKK